MVNNKLILVICYLQIFLFILLSSACKAQQATLQYVTPTMIPLAFSTATLIPTITPPVVPSPLFPTLSRTTQPVSVVTTAQINIRELPSVESSSLGFLDPGISIEAIGKNVDNSWLKIIYPVGSATTGWVNVAFVKVSESDLNNLPRLSKENIDQSGTEIPFGSTTSNPNESPTPEGHTGRVKNKIFIRSGPGQIFESLGELSAGTIVEITGRNINNIWAQISFSGVAGGKAWVATAYLEGANYIGLPYFDNQGKLLSSAESTPGKLQITGLPTAYPTAIGDGDSKKKPSARLVFSPSGAREFSFSSDLSSPQGDSTDWVDFIPYESTNQGTILYFKLECSGNGGITSALVVDGIAQNDWKGLTCGNYDFPLKVLGGKVYTLILSADGSFGPVRYIKYNLIISTIR